MRRLISILAVIVLLCSFASAQGLGGVSKLGGVAQIGGLAGTAAAAVVTYDVAVVALSASSSYSNSFTVGGGHTNTAIAAVLAIHDTGSVTVTSVIVAGVTLSLVGSQLNGNGSMRAFVYCGIGPATGVQSASVTLSGAPSTDSGLVAWSLYNVNQSNPCTAANNIRVLSGALTVTTNANDMGVSADFDSGSNRSVTGCTSSTDVSTFGGSSLGGSGAHCSATSPSFTWSAFGANSIAVGVDVAHL